jgi:protein-ribulosamine 3-kinase
MPGRDASPLDDAMAGIAAQIGASLGLAVSRRPAQRTHGGCINESYRWESASGPLFVKVAPVSQRPMFEAEAEGLRELASADAVRVPGVLAVGATTHHAWLALEWIDFGSGSAGTQATLGRQLARLHARQSDRFGWKRDNTIGSTPQENAWLPDWSAFFRERRLRYQLNLARRNGHAGSLQDRGAELLERMHLFFSAHAPGASLLHGDLWGGNAGADSGGRPVIFDPAVYYGDREADLAMTQLFGGFSRAFHEAYAAEWPLPDGADVRVDLYNLYHVLNHLNLFGTGYLRQAQGLIGKLLSHVGR